MGVNDAHPCYRELGGELVRLRKAAGMTGDDIARRAVWSRSKVWRIEAGYADLSVTDVIHYVVLCGLTLPQAADILELARLAERKQGYWLARRSRGDAESLRSLIFHESSAHRSTNYDPLLVPGLLQTPGYAGAQIAHWPGLAPTDVDAALRTRLERQQILRWEHPARFTFFVHEQALRLQIGGPAIMHEQLLQLVFASALDHVAVRIVPSATGERSAFGGPFRLLEYAKHRPLLYLDHHRGGGLFLEDRQYVENYRRLLPELTVVSLDEEESRSFAADLADEYDRGSQLDAAHDLAEEQL